MATVTPNYSWPVPTSTDLVKDGATAIEALGDAIDATVFGLGGSGLTLISTTTIGSGVSAASVNDCFSATYTNYRVIVKPNAYSTADVLKMRFRVSGADNTSNDYRYGGVSFGTSFDPYYDANYGTNNITLHRYGRANGTHLVMDIFNPFATNYTTLTSTSAEVGTGPRLNNLAGGFLLTTSFTGFTIFPDGGTISGGTIKVYGYKE